MAKNLWLNGTLYSNVEEVTLPQANAQGTGPSTYGVNYYDVSPTTADYDKVLSGYSFFESDGSFYEGTIPTLSEADVQVNSADSGSPFSLHFNSVLIPIGYYPEEVSLSPVFSEVTYSSARAVSVDEYGNVTTTFSPSTRGFAYSTITYSVTKSSAFHIMSSSDYAFQFNGVDANNFPLITVDANNGGYQFNRTFSITGDVSIDTQGASTYYVSTADRTIASSKWLTGAQTIKSVITTNLSASNIVSGVTIKIGDSGNASRIAQVIGTAQIGTDTSDATLSQASQLLSGITAYAGGSKYTGNLVVTNYYTGTSVPTSSLGDFGDIYLQVQS